VEDKLGDFLDFEGGHDGNGVFWGCFEFGLLVAVFEL
jgi:hypothetical protein